MLAQRGHGVVLEVAFRTLVQDTTVYWTVPFRMSRYLYSLIYLADLTYLPWPTSQSKAGVSGA